MARGERKGEGGVGEDEDKRGENNKKPFGVSACIEPVSCKPPRACAGLRIREESYDN